MKRASLPFTSLRYHWRANLGLLAGSALAAAILAGALVVGDSARFSLGRIAQLRLGGIHFFAGGSRLLDGALADRLRPSGSAPLAPVLQLPGSAALDNPAFSQPGAGDASAVNRIQIIGIDPSFHSLGGPECLPLADDQVAISRRLADELGANARSAGAAASVKPGDTIVLRVAQPALLSRDAPLSSRSQALSVRFTATIVRIVPDEQLGGFSLEAGQAPPRNAFVNLAGLQNRLKLPGRINLLLFGRDSTRSLSTEIIESNLARAWRLSDLGLSIRTHEPSGVSQLESDRIFLDPPIVETLVGGPGPASPPPDTVATLAYLVNSISREAGGESRSTPYSFVLAATPSTNRALSPVPETLRDDQVMLNRWLATELGASTGDTVNVAWYELLPGGQFQERTRPFTVHSIVEMESLAAEKELMPAFPGLSDVESCADWDIGMPLDKTQLNDKANEEYWNRHRQTPKALFTWNAGREMWANRFGNATAIRFPSAPGAAAQMETRLRAGLHPSQLGLGVVPVRQLADEAVAQATDLGGLFLGMSFFLLVAALLLTGLLHVFSVTRRAGEMGILLALGFTRTQVRRLWIVETGMVALVGSVLGGFLGLSYSQGLIWGLNRLWSGAVAGLDIPFHPTAGSVIAGAAAGFLAALVAGIIATWRQLGHTPLQLLRHDFSQGLPRPAFGHTFHADITLALLGTLIGLGILSFAHSPAGEAASVDPSGAFFGAGASLLTAFIAGMHWLLRPSSRPTTPARSLARLAFRNTRRRPSRGTAVTGLLAGGCFMVLAVASMRSDLSRHADQPGSGTGGFALWAEATIPIPGNPGTPEGRRKLKIPAARWPDDVPLLALKIHEGDDASCFNLNRAPTPRLIGVDSAALAARGAFVPPGHRKPLWELLSRPLPDGAIPALAGDAHTAIWGLQKKAHPVTGDTLLYRDDRGQTLRVKLVGTLPMPLSIFQGTLLIDLARFTESFPFDEGHRLLLIDAGPARQADIARRGAGALDRYGLDVQPTRQRLRDFYTVEESYLAMFLVLGGLGLLLGTAGLALVVFRNVAERRSELATLRAIGYPRSSLHLLLVLEHAGLLLAGVLGGTLAALLAGWPALTRAESGISIPALITVAATLTLAGLAWIALSSLLATKGEIAPTMRND